MGGGATTYTSARFGPTRGNSGPIPAEDHEIAPYDPRPGDSGTPRGGTLAEDVHCASCGHNLRGCSVGGTCPECGRPIKETLDGMPVDPGSREHAADGVRRLGRSYLLSAGAALAGVGCVGPVMVVLGLVGAAQRLMSLRAAQVALPRSREGQFGQLLGRAMAICAAEIAAGLLALAGPSVIGTFATSATAAASGTVFAAAWLGVTALGAVASWLLIDEAIARYALEVERQRLPAVLAVAATAPIAAALLLGAIPGQPAAFAFLAGALRIAGIALWVVAALLLAHQGSSAGDELAGGPRRRRTVTTEARPGAQPARRAARRTPPDDDAPIPLE